MKACNQDGSGSRLVGMRITAGLLTLACVLAGCGKAATPGSPGQPDAPDAPALPIVVDASCPKPAPGAAVPDGMDVQRGAIPEDFATTWVLRCRNDMRTKPGEGTWNVQFTERADTDAKELIEQLRRPSDPQANQACTMELRVPPYFALVDASGKAILPAIPTDGCGKPRIEIFKSLDALAFRTLSETPINQSISQKSIDTGCSDSWKDLTTFENVVGDNIPTGPVWSFPVTTLRICFYDSPGTGPDQVGKLTNSRIVDGDAAKALTTLLDKAGAAVTCSTPHTGFVTVSPMSPEVPAMIELDGCYRLLRPDNTLAQLNPTTVASLRG